MKIMLKIAIIFENSFSSFFHYFQYLMSRQKDVTKLFTVYLLVLCVMLLNIGVQSMAELLYHKFLTLRLRRDKDKILHLRLLVNSVFWKTSFVHI